MSALRQSRNFWILWVTTVVLACCSNAVAQVSYKVTDLGVLHNWNQGCAMALNNQGWTEDHGWRSWTHPGNLQQAAR